MTISQFPIPAGGIPTGDTAGRPANPAIGDVYYNGQLGILEIYDGTSWIACSSPPGAPTISATNVGTNVSYGSAQASVTFTAASGAGTPLQYTVNASTGGYSATTSGTTATITVGNNGSYTFSGVASNNFGTSVSGPTTTVTLTTVPQAPTIGTATAGNSSATLTFTAGNTGGSSITNYKYSTDNSTYTAFNPAQTTSPLTISGLTNGTTVSFYIKAVNANGDSSASAQSNSVVPTNQIEIDYLVIGGGGGVGGTDANNASGGGGAGGYRSASSVAVTLGTTYTITVGGGGAHGTTNYAVGNNGTASAFGTFEAAGGGKGGQADGGTGGNGGSGGGGGGASGAGGTGNTPNTSPSQGSNGGQGNPNSGQRSGGGGGGATAAGLAGTAGSTGGAGSNAHSSWATATSSGASGYYAGGGGGGGQGTAGAGAGGAGGGGAGGASGTGTGTNGTANTGGGGGGAGSAGNNGGDGGSGIVIIRKSGSYTAAGTTGSPTRYETGGYTYYKFTSSGSITI